MNRTEHNPEALLDAAIGEVRNDGIDPQVVEEARRRVWARLREEAERTALESAVPTPAGHIRGCADFQRLMPDYRAGKLSLARRMLLEDHVHECVACRKAMRPEAQPQMRPAAKVVEMPQRSFTPKKWAIAAMVVLGVGSTVWFGYDRFGPAPAGARATLVNAEGAVYRLAGGDVQAVTAGATFQQDDRIRTATGGHAMVKLLDGSTVEVSDRSELSVRADRRNTEVYLSRGRIIVQAAKRTRGHLYVHTGDARVAVTGTVFSVNRGVAGSRVAVIEGSVDVQQGGDEYTLRPGDQRTTHPSIAKVNIADEIAWSHNFEQHLALLQQFVDLKEKLASVQMPGLRYSSRLMDAVPDGTTVYINVPNLTRAVTDVQRIVTDQARQSPEMGRWLEHEMPQFEEFTSRLTTFGNYLGDEVTFAFQKCSGFCGVAIAEVHRPGLKEFLEKEIAASGGKAPFRIVEGPSIPPTRKGELLVDFHGNRVIIGEQSHLVAAAAKGGSGFAATPFGQAVNAAFQRGTGIVFAVNLERIASDEFSSRDKDREFAARVGIDRMKYLIAEQRTFDNNRAEYLASVRFDSARKGIASWLAEPGAMGSLQFVSPGAQFATSLVVKNPSQMLEEALALAGSNAAALEKLNAETGVDLKQEVVSALGGEVTFAFDGPMLPTPSWKLILEVNDPAKLQRAIEKIVPAVNRHLTQDGKPEITIEASQSEGQPSQGVTWGRGQKLVAHVLKTGLPLAPEIHYAFVDGYMVLAASEGLLMRSVNDRMAGVSLARSRRFTRLLPRNEQTSFSAMVYQNAGELLGLLAKGGSAAAGVTPDQQRRVDEIASRVEPMLVCVYGEADRIEIASQGSAWDVLMNSLAGVMLSGGPQSPGTRAGRHSYR